MFTILRVLSCTAIGFASLQGPLSSLAVANDPGQAIAEFETHIRPLLAERCYSCHSSRSGNREGGLLLDSRAGWLEGGDNGPVIVPGDLDGSSLIRAVRYADSDLEMPPDRKLSEAEIARLEKWVKRGAIDPRDEVSSETDQPIKPSDPISGREHWAFRPLGDALPVHSTTKQDLPGDWDRSSIDVLVSARRTSSGLPTPPDADRRALARRVYIQLIGMPPTAEELAEFVDDRHPNPLERLVDHLLASPRFGERWGRHWLDLARYSDSNGLAENFLFREAWRYRNRVIESFNANMPFDHFLREQIAGDLLPFKSIAEKDRLRISAGFLVLGPKILLIEESERMQQRMDVADELIDTIGKAVLGQTLGCARCHDHKFDPIPTADYYAMAGILASTTVLEERQMLGQLRVMEHLVGIGENGIKRDEEYEQYWIDQKERKEKKQKIQRSMELLRSGDVLGLLALSEEHDGIVTAIALDPCAEFGQRIESQSALLVELQRTESSPPPIPPRAMVPKEADNPSDEAIRLAGQVDRLGKRVPRGFLQVLTRERIDIADGTSGRLELANWLTDTESGAGHLTARVLANRIWHHLIGRGIVRTTDNFGRTGEPPSHPELLDLLAKELIDSGWSIKSLIRKIVLTRTFAMSSRHTSLGHSIDPQNRLLWRAHRRRVDPETFRDAMLHAAGTLDLRPFDSTVDYLGDQATSVGANENRRRTDFPCRSVYLPVIRNDLPELFKVFDFANPQATTGLRSDTMVGTQGLFTLNDKSVIEASEDLAERLLSEVPLGEHTDERRVDRMFDLVLGERPAKEEVADIVEFVNDFDSTGMSPPTDEVTLRAWSTACQALFASSRFQVTQ